MFNFEIRQLEYFVAAASTGSYAQAAKALFVSPQAVSRGIQVLEGHLGTDLFKRGPLGIALTDFGEAFYEESKAAMQSLERLQNIADRHRTSVAVPFSLGIISLAFKEYGGTIDWNDLLEFQDAHPDAQASFVEMHGDSIISAVQDGLVDFGVSVIPPESFEPFERRLLKSFPVAALVSNEEQDFALESPVTIKELTQGQLILFSGEDAFNNIFVRRAQEEGLTVKTSPLQNRAKNDIHFAHGEKLYILRPIQHATRTTKGDDIRILPIVDSSGSAIESPLYVFWKKDRKLSTAEEEFVNMIINLYA